MRQWPGLDLSARVRRLVLLLGLAAAGVASAAPPRCPFDAPLRIGFFTADLGVYLHGSGYAFAETPGTWVDETRAALAALGCTATLTRQALPRTLRSLEAGELDFVIGLGHSAAREARWAFPSAVGLPLESHRLSRSEMQLLVAAGTAAQAPPRVVAATRATLAADWARARGWQVEETPDVTHSLEMLRRGRVQAVWEPRLLIDALPAAERTQVSALGSYPEAYDFFAVASPRLVARQPAAARAFWGALCQAARASRPLEKPCTAPERP